MCRPYSNRLFYNDFWLIYWLKYRPTLVEQMFFIISKQKHIILCIKLVSPFFFLVKQGFFHFFIGSPPFTADLLMHDSCVKSSLFVT